MKQKMRALARFQINGVGVVNAGDEFECDAQRATYLEHIGIAVKMDAAPKNKMARKPRNKGAKDAV